MTSPTSKHLERTLNCFPPKPYSELPPMTASLVKAAHMIAKANGSYRQLPPDAKPFQEFNELFRLGGASTEKYHPLTKSLSQTMQRDTKAGLKLLIEADKSVLEGYIAFLPTLQKNIPVFSKTLKEGGRIILLGAGSSGRIAVDLAAKCAAAFPNQKDQIIGIIAGGDSAMVRAKEGFEDSASDGEKTLAALKPGPKDIVIPISASGSASFNVGAAHHAANEGALTFYFYNSFDIPDRTAELFKRVNNPVQKLLVDIGAQSIGGSTRLQAASVGEACLGALLEAALFDSIGETKRATKALTQIQQALERGAKAIEENLEGFCRLVELENALLSSPESNTRRIRDETEKGYITSLADALCYRELGVDHVELPPTYSVPTYEREADVQQSAEKNTTKPKRPPFKAFVIDEETNLDAWRALLGREPHEADLADINQFLLSTQAEGNSTYSSRPKGKGNLVVGVAKLNYANPKFPAALEKEMEAAQAAGAETGLILLSSQKIEPLDSTYYDILYHDPILLDGIPEDPLGVAHTLVLKQALNLISNGAMVLGGNVYGNRMINVSASNMKLVDRAMRLIEEIWIESSPGNPLNREMLYSFVTCNAAKIKQKLQEGNYSPSVVKITLAMIHLEKTPDEFEEVVAFLIENKESLDFLAAQ